MAPKKKSSFGRNTLKARAMKSSTVNVTPYRCENPQTSNRSRNLESRAAETSENIRARREADRLAHKNNRK